MDDYYGNALEFADVVSKRPDADEYLEKHKAAFNYAYRESGMNAYFRFAKLFAADIAEKPDAFAYVERHKKAFRFAVSVRGPAMNWEQAKRFAKVVERKDWERYLDDYQKAIEYAQSGYDKGGLNSNPETARKFAEERAEAGNALSYIENHRRCFHFAYFGADTEGWCLNLSREDAIKFADKALEVGGNIEEKLRTYQEVFKRHQDEGKKEAMEMAASAAGW